MAASCCGRLAAFAQLLEHIGGQGGQGRFQQDVGHELRADRFFVFRRFGWFRWISRLWWLVCRVSFRGLFRLGLGLLLRLLGWWWQTGGTRRDDQPRGSAQVLFLHRVKTAQSAEHTGQSKGRHRRTQAVHTQGHGGLTQRLHLRVCGLHLLGMQPHRLQVLQGQGGQHHLGFFIGASWAAQLAQVQPNAQTLLQATRQGGLVVQGFVQRGHANESGRCAHHALVQHLAQDGGGVVGQSLGHGQEQHRGDGLLQQTRQVHRPSCLQGGAQVQAAQQALGVGMVGQAAGVGMEFVKGG